MADAKEPKETPHDTPGATSQEETGPKIDKAVDDIVRAEADDELKTQDEASYRPTVMKQGIWERFKNARAAWWGNPRKKWATIAAIVVVLGTVFAVPFTRYTILGLALRAPVTVQVVDSKAGSAVSGVRVAFGGTTAETDAEGKATLRPHTGPKTLQTSKQYYTSNNQQVLVTLSSSHNHFKVKLVALGRQVQVKVTNKITGKAVADAKITAGKSSAKTNQSGLATLILASGATTQSAEVALSGYNSTKVTITASGKLTKNTFAVTPAGELYFLSNRSGTIDVVKTNLDGTARQTVLAGTGSEDLQNTSLLASRDWKYLALLSKRSGDNASVYLIDTTNGDKLSTVDEGNADFSLVGWSGDRLVYKVDRSSTVSNWQANQQAVKSFDPTTGHTLLLDQTQASGTVESDYTKQYFGSVYLMDNQVVYTKNWDGGKNIALTDKQPELDTINGDGSNHHTVKTFESTNPVYAAPTVETSLYEPNGLYVQFQNDNQTEFYDYEDGKVSADTTMTLDKFYSTPYSTYLLSPSGNQTFWAEERDGKNAMLLGTADAKNPKQAASLSEDYNVYGWYTDNYLLVSKNSSELYVLSTNGGTPLKITDYYKPAINYQGYGGGYGGL